MWASVARLAVMSDLVLRCKHCAADAVRNGTCGSCGLDQRPLTENRAYAAAVCDPKNLTLVACGPDNKMRYALWEVLKTVREESRATLVTSFFLPSEKADGPALVVVLADGGKARRYVRAVFREAGAAVPLDAGDAVFLVMDTDKRRGRRATRRLEQVVGVQILDRVEAGN